MIMIFASFMQNDDISRGIFLFFKFWFFEFLEGKKAKNGPKWQKVLSVVLDISGIIHHMVVIYGVHV